MTLEEVVHRSVVRLVIEDITDLDVEAFVYYARPDLQLGAGFGTAISLRGGPSVQVELNELGPQPEGAAVVTGAGKLKASHIIHAVGPRFQEEEVESKLRETVLGSLRAAEEHGIRQIAFPPMGAGFYAIPLEQSARVTLGAIREYLSGETEIREVLVCARDNREYRPFRDLLAPAHVESEVAR